MKIIINKQANIILKRIKKHLVCSDSTAIIVMHEFMKRKYTR